MNWKVEPRHLTSTLIAYPSATNLPDISHICTHHYCYFTQMATNPQNENGEENSASFKPWQECDDWGNKTQQIEDGV